MRLKDSDKNAILQQTSRFAPGGDTYLFGSRTDSAARGGDIDILLLTQTKLPLRLLREMRRAILSEIGEQKLDIVNFSRGQQHPFKDIALQGAVKL
jgi:predicted nucleotidyltransferase